MGLSHDGFEFLKGSFEGLKGYTVGRMTKSHRGKLYIDDAGWGPEASSIEYGYRVPFGGIHIFIGKISEPGLEPDICTDLVETAQRASPARIQPAMKRAFVGCVHGSDLNQCPKVRRPSILMASHPPAKPSPCTKFMTVCLKGIPMALVFRNFSNRQTESESSWPEYSQPCNILLRQRPDR